MNGIENLLDQKLLFFVNKTLSVPSLDVLMPFVTDNAPLLLLPVLAFLFLQDRKDALLALVLSLSALALSDGISNILKHHFERPRPFQVLTEINVLVGKGRSFSMPSAHAANVTSVSTVLAYMLLRLRSLAFISRRRALFMTALAGYVTAVASAVAFSRVYVGVHYPSDVIAGVVLGLLAGLFTIVVSLKAGEHYRRAPCPTVLALVLLVLSLFRIYYILVGPLDLSPDEAQYWDWSRRLGLSYYSKGPAVAYIIAAGRALLGNTEMGVRLPAVLFSLLSSVVLYVMTRDIMKREVPEGSGLPGAAGLVAALLPQVVPLFSAYGVIMTIDSPFIFFWSLSLYLFYRAVRDWPERGEPKLLTWMILGLAVGIGLLVKYTMAFFYLSAFLCLAADRDRRRLLLQPTPYLSFLVSLAAFSPVLIWNSMHDWVTFRHTAGQAHIADGVRLTLDRFLEFGGSQLGVISPVLLVFMLISLFVLRKRSEAGGILFWFSIPVLLFFTLKSFQGKVQANWALPAYISGFVALGIYTVKYWHGFRRPVRALLVTGVLMSVAISAAAHYPSLINLPPKMDPSARLRGWRELGEEISRRSGRMERPYFIFSDKYQVTSELAFYVKGNPVTYCVNLGRRMNQYDIWPGFHDLKGYDAIFVMLKDNPLPKVIRDAFEGCRKDLFSVREKEWVLRTYTIFECRGFKGMEQKAPEKF